MYFLLPNMIIDAELDRLVREIKRKISVSGRFPEPEILPELEFHGQFFVALFPGYGVTSPIN